MIGIESEGRVPKKWNVSRFLEVLGREPHRTLLHRLFDTMARRLAECVPDLGRRVAGDATSLNARRKRDKAGDSSEVHVRLRAAGIKPVIQNRALWKQEYERMLPGHDGRSNIVYDESGTVFCYDRASNPPVRHRMAYMGHEKSRGTLKYRCPAVYEGWECPSHERCNGTCPSGKTVRVKQDIDLRRFPAIPRATKQFERLYKERTSVERVNARFKVFWGVDDGNITGSARFYAYVGAIMVAHLGFATLLAARPQSERTLGRMRLAPLKRAMREKLAG